MNNKNKNRKTIYFLLCIIMIIVVPLVINLIIWIPYKVMPAGDENGWLGFFGGYLGSLLGVFVAYKIEHDETERLERQFLEEQKIQRDHWLIEQYPSIYKMDKEIKSLKEVFEKTKNHLKENKGDVDTAYTKKLLSDLKLDI